MPSGRRAARRPSRAPDRLAWLGDELKMDAWRSSYARGLSGRRRSDGRTVSQAIETIPNVENAGFAGAADETRAASVARTDSIGFGDMPLGKYIAFRNAGTVRGRFSAGGIDLSRASSYQHRYRSS
jgi:hypothetical protein